MWTAASRRRCHGNGGAQYGGECGDCGGYFRPPGQTFGSGFFSYLDEPEYYERVGAESGMSKATVVIKPKVQQLGAVGGFDQKHQAIKLGTERSDARGFAITGRRRTARASSSALSFCGVVF